MRMMEKKKTESKCGWRIRSGRKLLAAAAAVWLAVGLSACSSKEAVLLEEELVRETEIPDGEARAESQEKTAGCQEEAAGLQKETAGETDAAADGAGVFPDGFGPEAAEERKQAEESVLFVHICGEVAKPGVYELPAGSRIFEAVEAAGGFTERASAGYVNLALELEDGWKVEIPALGGEPEARQDRAQEQNAGDGAVTRNMAGITGNTVGFGGETESTEEKDGGLVDINTAGKQELCTLPGVGESRAESIISYREKNGRFGRIEDIMKVEGIKEGMFSKMKDKICVGK